MATPHERAVAAALDADNELRRLFAQMGNTEHPRGRILRAYRQARRAMGQQSTPAVVVDILTELRATLAGVMRQLLDQAAAAGAAQAATNLAAYQLPDGPDDYQPEDEWAAWMAAYDAQAAQVRGLALTGADAAILTGDDSRAGALTPAPILTEGARWLAIALGAGFTHSIESALLPSRATYLRQAVAAIDDRTTDCCLRVHGQTVPFNRPFRLTGTPRFADEIMWPPFHWYCRTAVALVRPEDSEDDLTRSMRASARREQANRASQSVGNGG